MKQILSHPITYNLLQNILSKKISRGLFINKYIKPKNGDRILDLGCGTGELLNILPENVSYTGIDISDIYIQYARKISGSRGQFIQGDICDIDFSLLGPFDFVIASGFFHHVDDSTITKLLDHIKPSLSTNVQLASLDGCYTDDQNFICKFFLSIDRGKYIRREKEYVNILKSSFNKIESFIHDDLLRIPYNHCILLCSKYKF